MTLNYTFSKSLDIGSRSESVGSFSGDFMINSWNAQQLRALSRYDATHQANAYFVYQLPFGRGRQFGSSMNRASTRSSAAGSFPGPGDRRRACLRRFRTAIAGPPTGS